MATLSTDTPRAFGLGDINELPVIASDIIYEGSAVGDNASGYSRPLVAGDPFQGFCIKKVDNSSGSAGDKNVIVRRFGLVQLAVTGASSVADNGRNVYASDDAVFTLTKGTNTKIGQVARWVTGTTCVVSFASLGSGAGAGYAEASITSLTDSSGGTANNTVEAVTAAATITDSSGGTDPGDDTIAAVTNIALLTDSSGGAKDNTVAAVAAPTDYAAHASGGTTVTSNAATDLDTTAAGLALLENEVTTAIGVTNDNFAEVTEELIAQRTANTAILAAIAQLAAKQNTTSTAVTAAMNNFADVTAKINQLIDDLEDLGVLTAV